MTALFDVELVTMCELSQSTQLEAVLRAWIKAGLCRKVGDWYDPNGKAGWLWSGEVWGYRVNFHSHGQRLVHNSFSFKEI